MPRAAPATRRRNRQREVVQAAVEVFWRKGYASASLQEVADVVGVLKGSLYHYIASKEDLLEAIVDDVQEQCDAIVDEVAALPVGAVERLAIYLERHALWCLSHRHQATVFVREWQHLTGDRLARVVEARRAFDHRVRALIQDAQAERGIAAPVPVSYASRFALAAVNAAPEWWDDRGPDTREHTAAIYARLTTAMLLGAVEPQAEDQRA